MNGFIWILIIAAVVYYFRRGKGKTGPRSTPQARPAIHLSISSSERSYMSYSGDFWTVTRDLAENMPSHESEVVIIIEPINDRYCSVNYQLLMDHTPIPDYFIFDSGISVSEDRTVVRFFAQKATGFTTPQLVLNMIVQDMSSPFTTITERSITPVNGREMVACRVHVKRNGA